MTDTNIPPTEPAVAAPRKKAADPVAAVAARVNTRTPGSELIPDLTQNKAAVETSYLYWIGALPGLPTEGIDLAGENFPKVTEDVIKDRDGKTVRIPRIGALVRISTDKMKRMRDRLRRTVVRFTNDPGQKEEPGTGQNLGDPYIRPRRGLIITIPTEADLKAREQRGMPARRYVQQKGDEPAARYMFAILCKNQETGERGDSYPDSIEVNGLDWPAPLKD